MQPMLRSDVFKINGAHVEEEGSKWCGICACKENTPLRQSRFIHVPRRSDLLRVTWTLNYQSINHLFVSDQWSISKMKKKK